MTCCWRAVSCRACNTSTAVCNNAERSSAVPSRPSTYRGLTWAHGHVLHIETLGQQVAYTDGNTHLLQMATLTYCRWQHSLVADGNTHLLQMATRTCCRWQHSLLQKATLRQPAAHTPVTDGNTRSARSVHTCSRWQHYVSLHRAYVQQMATLGQLVAYTHVSDGNTR